MSKMLNSGYWQSKMSNSGSWQSKMLNSGYWQSKMSNSGSWQSKILNSGFWQTLTLTLSHNSTEITLLLVYLALTLDKFCWEFWKGQTNFVSPVRPDPFAVYALSYKDTFHKKIVATFSKFVDTIKYCFDVNYLKFFLSPNGKTSALTSRVFDTIKYSNNNSVLHSHQAVPKYNTIICFLIRPYKIHSGFLWTAKLAKTHSSSRAFISKDISARCYVRHIRL